MIVKIFCHELEQVSNRKREIERDVWRDRRRKNAVRKLLEDSKEIKELLWSGVLLDVVLADENQKERTSLHLPALFDELQGILHTQTNTDAFSDWHEHADGSSISVFTVSEQKPNQCH